MIIEGSFKLKNFKKLKVLIIIFCLTPSYPPLPRSAGEVGKPLSPGRGVGERQYLPGEGLGRG